MEMTFEDFWKTVDIGKLTHKDAVKRICRDAWNASSARAVKIMSAASSTGEAPRPTGQSAPLCLGCCTPDIRKRCSRVIK